ncbi:MAG: PTS sugar transporter subunit IIA [Erysipelotrichaceae bacterium]
MNKLNLDLIKLNMSFQTKEEAIKYCGMIFVNNGYVTPGYIEDMIARDKECSVYIGNEVAIPHGLASSDKKIINTGIVVVQVPDGVDFESGNAKILIAIAAKNNEQLEILSRIANICIDTKNISSLISATTKDEINKILMLKGANDE